MLVSKPVLRMLLAESLANPRGPLSFLPRELLHFLNNALMEPNQIIPVELRTLNGRRVDIWVNVSWVLEDLEDTVSEITGIPLGFFKLMLNAHYIYGGDSLMI